MCASNDITEEILVNLNKEGARIDSYGIGTHLVTCKAQPALGGVYKLVEIDGKPRMKMTEDISKATLPGCKDVYRLYLASGEPYADLIRKVDAEMPKPGEQVTCIHPHDELQRVVVKPAKVERLYKEWIHDGKLLYPHHTEGDQIVLDHPDPTCVRNSVLRQICCLREDHKRFLNPTPFKVSVDEEMNSLIRKMALGCKTVRFVQ